MTTRSSTEFDQVRADRGAGYGWLAIHDEDWRRGGVCPESLNPWQLVAGMEVAGDWSWAVLVSGSRSDVLHSGSRRLPPFSGVESENRINCHIRYRGDVSAPRIEPCPGDDIRHLAACSVRCSEALSPPAGRTWLGPVMVSVCITASSEWGQMIARIWRGWASQATAGDYQRHYETEVSRHLQDVNGFCGARLLRCDDGQEVMFTSVAFFISIDAVRSFAGEDYEQAIVEEAARRALNRWDERVSHHDVSVDLPGAS